MSLGDQSQQWYPTSVRVTVHQAKDLRAKGKNGTNDAYAIIQVAKDKFSTTVAEKSVSPVWKEEATFDLPLFHPGNADRCTLYIIVMHKAHVGLDKFLGQAVVNLLELHDDKGRKRTDWFKLVDKASKEDKARGQVLIDIQFMRNNISASMLDLSMQDKPRSRISKIKDKVRGKKKDGFSDSASAIVPSVSQVLTDSEGEGDSASLSQSPGVKKKSKFKTLFAPKSNLQRNVSQSMSTLGTLPEKNSSLSSSRSSGLNVDSPDVKKKFKFLGHKRTGSSDSKVSQGPFSLLSRSKQSDLNNLCINGSHVYAEEAEAKTGSTMSLNSSGHGSVEDIRKQHFDIPVDVPVDVPTHSSSQFTDRALLDKQRHQEEQRRIVEAKRQEEEDRRRIDALRLQQEEERRYQEEQERKRQQLEDDARRRKLREEEEMMKNKEEEQRRAEEVQKQELLKAEEQKKQEEASMSERLTSLFGMIRKKEEKKEVLVVPELNEKLPESMMKTEDQLVSQQSINPFVEVSLSTNDSSIPESKAKSSTPIPSAMVFLNRTAKVKPRLDDTLKSDSTDSQTSSSQNPSIAVPESPPSTVAPSETSDSFQDLHFLLAPQSKDLSETFGDDFEEISSSVEDSENMGDKKRRAPVPPSYPVNSTLGGGREILNPAYVEPEEQQPSQRMSFPLPDYETLFPQKRHGVQGQTRWDHIIAEVNQKHRDNHIELTGKEMSVDSPEERLETPRNSLTQVRQYQMHSQASKPASSKSVAAPDPPKKVTPPQYKTSIENHQRPNQDSSQKRLSIDSTQKQVTTESGSARKVLHPSSAQAPRPMSQLETDRSPQGSLRKTQTVNEEAPTAKPRQKPIGRESMSVSEIHAESDLKKSKSPAIELDPFPNNNLLSKDPWAQTQQFHNVDLFTDNGVKKPEEHGMTPDDLDSIFRSDSDPFTASTEHFFQPKQHKSQTPEHQTEHTIFHDREDPYPVTSTAPFDPLPVVVEEPAPSGLIGSKAPIRAWVSPSEVQPVSVQTSSGGGLALSQRRPHPVKPLNPVDTHQPSSTPAITEITVQDIAPSKFKVSGSSETGPFTQLTQGELITLVVKQQADLSKKDAKIAELEEYIDNLLVRVIEEKPSILHSLEAKPQ
ncbi:unnamed protein product [Knipowitschia caucasica]